MASIQQLPPGLINKIAAGEVIERPASVVKELVENSVDAGATQIDVCVEKGGVDLIRVADNGSGISADELPLAVASHATSKISSVDDLFHVHSFGFRGEALASISEVSQFVIRSRTPHSDAGAELTVTGGELAEVVPCGCQTGTVIEIRNLFFNTPVRRKFTRTTQTELSHISEAVTRVALAHPQIKFSLKHNDREMFALPPVDDLRPRIVTLFGQEVADALIEVSSEEQTSKIYGFVADPSQSRSNNRMQYLFLNGRHIRDRSLGHALGEAYRGLLMTGRYPIAFLHIEIPCDDVDVNVHPTKLEVRFVDGGRLYSQLLSMLRNRFLSTDLTAKADLGGQQDASLATAAPPTVPAFKPFGSGDAATHRPANAAARQTTMDVDFGGTTEPRVSLSVGCQPHKTVSAADEPASSTSPQSLSHPEAEVTGPPPSVTPGVGYSEEGTPAMQVCNRYLVTENEEGVVVIDQHALHERIIYEELREKVLAGSIEVQRLLVPEPVQLLPEEASALIDAKKTLTQLGIKLESLSNTSLLVTSYPAMLSNIAPGEMLRQLADKLTVPNAQIEQRDLIDELLHMISCKAAIKAGDRLSRDEVLALVSRRHLVQDAHHCPHGRPTTLVFSRDELDRRFKRV